MGRKGNWISAIKKVFTHNSKDKLPNETEKKSSNDKKGRGRLKHGENRSFIPLFRGPSSIEKILGEVDQQLLFISHPTHVEHGHPTHVEQPTTQQPSFSGKPASPKVTSQWATSPRVPSSRFTSHRATSPRTVSPKSSPPGVVHKRSEVNYRPEPTLRHHHHSATIIQAAYRGYMARRSYRALRGLVRLQGVVRGQNVKRQTVNAMKQMQLLVRVQTQIQSRRIQMLENEALERQTHNNGKEVESLAGKQMTFSNLLEMGDGHWDDSLMTKEEREARLQKKMDAVIKRERAMAYAYSHQLWKATPKSAQNALTEIRSGGFPWWWNWLERQLPSDEPTKNPEFTPTPPRPNSGPKTSPRPQSSTYKQSGFSFENLNTPTPKSSKSTVPTPSRPLITPTQTPPSTTPNLMKHYKTKGGSVSGSPYPIKDDDSLMSCPPFSVPSYMSPTVSAKAKARPTSNPKDRLPSTAASETSKRRFSFPLTQNIGSSFRWNKKSSNKDSTATTMQEQMVLKKHKSPRSIGDMSMDSSISMPAAYGRKPFNRFV